MKTNLVKAVGIVATVAGVFGTLAGNWVGEQKTNAKIEDAVNKAIAEKTNEEETEENED